MNHTSFSRNLRKFRLSKGLTQEQLAQKLGVSVQSISRWECGNTLPDVLLLPEIARTYHVTVDDLYREDAAAYPSYAQRLLAVYESSGRTEDFLSAEQEFSRLAPEELTADDLRAWGVLYHYMMQHCASQAQQKLEQAIHHPEGTEQIRSSAAQQKLDLLCDLGRGRQVAQQYDQAVATMPGDSGHWLLCAAAHHRIGENQRALEVALEGIRRFPDKAAFRIYAGDICRALGRTEEAFCHYRQALAMDPSALDPLYAMASYHEELEDYDAARKTWLTLAEELERRGMTVERQYPLAQAERCLRRQT